MRLRESIINLPLLVLGAFDDLGALEDFGALDDFGAGFKEDKHRKETKE